MAAMDNVLTGMSQMLDRMVETSVSGMMTVDEIIDLDVRFMQDPAKTDEAKRTMPGKIIRHYMLTKVKPPGAPADQLAYIIKYFLMSLPKDTTDFPKRDINSPPLFGGLKVPLHPLKSIKGSVVSFVPYMIINVDGELIVLSAHTFTRSSTTKISAWVFDQKTSHAQMVKLEKKGISWTPIDDPTHPSELFGAKHAILKEMHWSSHDHTDHDGNVRKSCTDCANEIVRHLLVGKPHAKLDILDVRYEGQHFDIKTEAVLIDNFAYAPEFPKFPLNTAT